MELTAKVLQDRLELIRIKEKSGELSKLSNRWSEKGVECGIIMPIVEIILDFNIVDDVEFESSSKEYNKQRFDFVINGDLLIEAKKFDEKLSDHYKQISKYMKNSDVKYILLTNGIDFEFFVKRKHVEDIRKAEINEKFTIYENLIKVISITYIKDVGSFLKIMSLFSKEKYNETFFKLIGYVCAHIGTEGFKKNYKIGIEKDIDKLVKNNIEKCISIEAPGYYYDNINNGKSDLKVGDSLIFDDYNEGGITIIVKINEYGNVVVVLNECDYHPVRAVKKYKKVIEVFRNWADGSNRTYSTPADIIKELTGHKKKNNSYNNLFVKL